MQQTKKRFTPRNMALVGVLAALVFALSWVTIPIADISRIHFGNVMCLLGGVLFGPYIGGLAAGFGSMLFDVTHPAYIAEFWITFLAKFAMGFVAGILARSLRDGHSNVFRILLSGITGTAAFGLLYLLYVQILQQLIPGLSLALVLAGFAIVAVVAGLLTWHFTNGVLNVSQYLLPALAGSLSYVVLYMLKSILQQVFVYGLTWQAAWPLVLAKGGVSLLNGAIAVTATVILAPVLETALKRAKLMPTHRQKVS